LISIPASAARSLAMPCGLGRISVTVDLAITEIDKAMAVPAGTCLANQQLTDEAALRRRQK
jgi:hypothetical protein